MHVADGAAEQLQFTLSDTAFEGNSGGIWDNRKPIGHKKGNSRKHCCPFKVSLALLKMLCNEVGEKHGVFF